MLRRYWWFVALVVVVALGATFLLTQRQERVYTAAARIQLRTDTTVSFFPFARTGPRDLLRAPEIEELYVQSPQFIDSARQQSPSGISVAARARANELVFTARGSDPEDVAAAANSWAETYLSERPSVFEAEIRDGIEFLEQTISGLESERAEVRAEVIQYEELLAETTDPDELSRLSAEKASIEEALEPQLSSIDGELESFTRQLTDLQAVTRFFDTPDVSAQLGRPAGVPSSPVSPNVTRNLAVGGLLGLALGVGLPYLRHALADKVDDRDDAVESTGLPTLAAIPTFKHGDGLSIEVVDHPGSPASERYQSLLTAIEFASIDEPISSLLFTSAAPGDGKTTTAVNIAALASRYMNVILVDADMRRPDIHHLVNGSNAVGLSDVLADNADFFDARLAFERNGTRFDILPAGAVRDDPALLLRGDAWLSLVAELFMYDLVIIDGPPVLAVTDALLLGQAADAQLLISRSGKTTRSELAEATELLLSSGSRSLGVVVNGEKMVRNSPYYRYYGEYRSEVEGGESQPV